MLIIIPAFLVTIGILVTVHEFGHFWVARKLGVKVLRFSIGFGKPLWKRVSGPDQTEYVIAALPLGGYVKMLDERDGEVAAQELHRAFNRQPVWKRFAVVAAGPIANFILAILIYALMFGTGNPAMHPYVQAETGTPAAAAGFAAGDKIVAINRMPVETWEDTRMLLLEEYLKSPVLSMSVVTQDGGQVERRLDLSGSPLLKNEGDFFSQSGLDFWAPEVGVGIGHILPGSAAEQAGLQARDKILAVDGSKPKSAADFVAYVQARPGQPIDFNVQRDAGVLNISVTPAAVDKDGSTVGQVGASVGEYLPEAVRNQLEFTQRLGPLDALVEGTQKTWQMSVVTLKLMGRMLTGDVSLKNISGPITIAKFSGETAQAGLPYYLGFLAIVSISLGILNLLPIPMLDGGHLLYYIIEIIKGSPVSERVEEYGFRFGMAVVAGIMVLALYNDFMRLLN
ncbi:MAG: RIP metalloprotease RseP [Thiolinea sp.]